MVSSLNPLSTTNRYYANPYDSKRMMPSVANNPKTYGEGVRDNYLRSGVESSNTPLNSTTAATFYSGFHGKKVVEVESEPLQKQPKFLSYHIHRIMQKCT